MLTKKRIFIFFIIAILGLGTYLAMGGRKKDGVRVKTEKTMYGEMEKYVELAGNIEAENSLEVRAPLQVKVMKVFVKEGEEVKPGQVLAELDATDLLLQKEKLILVKATYQKDLEELIRKGKGTEKSDLINSLQSANSKLVASRAKLEESQRIFKEKEEQYRNGIIPYEEYAKTKAEFISLNAQYDADKSTYDSYKNKEKEYDTDLKNRITNKERQIEQTELDIQTVDNKISDTKVKSEIKGVLALFDLKENEKVSEKNSLIKIIDKSGYKFISSVPQEDAVLLKTGQTGKITLKSTNLIFNAVLSKIGQIATEEGANAKALPKQKIEFVIKEPFEGLVAGYEGEALVLVGKTDKIVHIKKEAVKKDATGNKFIYVIQKDKAKKVIVKTGVESDYEVQIKEGLVADQEYITSSETELKDNLLIQR